MAPDDPARPWRRAARERPAVVQVEEFEPGERSLNWMSALSFGLLLGGLALGAGLIALGGGVIEAVEPAPRYLLRVLVGMTVATAATLVVHELLHGLAFLLLGARPRFGAGVLHSGLPYLYTTCDNRTFTRGQFAVVAALPNVVVNLGLLAALLAGREPAWWVLPLAVHLSGGVGDAWLVWAALHEPRGTLIEDRRSGIKVHRPIARTDRPGARPWGIDEN